MSSKLTVIFYIILCLEAGIVLTLLPWVHPFGMGDWGNNYFLLYASQKTGLQGLQMAISSGWVRGAVTGLGVLNLAMAFWEIAHFRQTVRSLENQEKMHSQTHETNAPRTAETDHLSDYERRDDAGDHSQ